MPTISIPSATHAYDLTTSSSEAGSACCETIVFIHGWLLSRSYWQPLVAELSADYHCLTYDLRGFGESTQPLREPPLTASDTFSRYSLAAYARDLKQLLDRLGLDQVWLLGHSLGGEYCAVGGLPVSAPN